MAGATGSLDYLREMHRDLVVAAAVGAALTAAVFAGLDVVRPDKYVVTAKAQSAQGAISADDGDWTYSIPLEVAWRDGRGAFHDSGRPECLPPSGKEEGPVQFTAIPVDVGGIKFRQVIFVDCI
jgi:hypothetical protein